MLQVWNLNSNSDSTCIHVAMETVGSISLHMYSHGISHGRFVYFSDKFCAGVWRFTVKYLLGLQPLRSVPIHLLSNWFVTDRYSYIFWTRFNSSYRNTSCAQGWYYKVKTAHRAISPVLVSTHCSLMIQIVFIMTSRQMQWTNTLRSE